jgi:glycine cleavage system regulatory protein
MKKNIICSFIGLDKTGLVEQLAKVINSCGGNWLESSMAQLAGHFAGIVRVNIDSANIDQLQHQLTALKQHGLSVQLDNSELIEAAPAKAAAADVASQLRLNIVGKDRSGIVHEVAQALAGAGINVLNMQTHLSSAPMSGDQLFHSTMDLANAQRYDTDTLERTLEKIAERLSIEIDLDSD